MTGIIYNELMCLHEEPNHPEQPDRIRRIFDAIRNSKLASKCKMLPTRRATEDELSLVHKISYINKLMAIPNLNKLALKRLERRYNSVYINEYSYSCALLSAGCVIELCDQIMQGTITNGIAIVRPPGHHAEVGEAMGFCLFNNVAIAAKAMINKYNLKREAIIDWDVLHGNATQHIFEEDPNVLYISIHRYDNAVFYPGSTDADPTMIGIGNGVGKNVNIAWNTNGIIAIGDMEYIYALNELIKPMLGEFNPELIIISAGFDCASGDQLGGVHVTPFGFNYMTRKIMEYANGKIAIALEGGYNLDAISVSAVACLEGLLNEPPRTKEVQRVSAIAIEAVRQTIEAHKPFWNFLKN